MTSRVTIQDKTEGQFLTFDLKEVLSVLPPIASALCWHLLELDGEGKPTSGLNWLDLQRQLDKAEAGVLYDWKELTEVPVVGSMKELGSGCVQGPSQA
jgi:hypothetical protein